jgi:IPT/TIG domain
MRSPRIEYSARSFVLRLAIALAVVLCCASLTRAGGPDYVAGSSYFNAGNMGQPLTWPLGQVNYYTDQGDLSPILPNASANALVANAFSQWTSVTSAALTATAAGQLAEDVNGGNIEVNSSGTVIAPADITPAATQTPVGIVYDYDGSVTDALLGEGAGDPSQCFWNAVYGGVDNFGATANFLHALVVINGQCALDTPQFPLTDLEYRLVRVLGTIVGLGWSQLNLNVITRNPAPTSADFAGFPVMHYIDPISCVPITICYANPYQLAPDDMAALSRLYPLNTPPLSSARIYGSVYFVNQQGAIAQPMQGANVVARWIDPSTNLPSDQYSVASVSGFLFTGNAGNPITGFIDPLGNAYSEFGSSDQTLEGFFDLGGLPIPNGANTAQYQLSVEPLDPLWSSGVCPYDPSQVAPSGSFAPILVTVAAGGQLEQDILMAGSAQPVPSWAASESWTAPAPVPAPGDWVGSLSGYGDVGYFSITAQANRTLSVAVTALDEASAPTESKAEPVVGMWSSADPQGTPPPALTTSPFNSATFGMTLLDAEILTSGSFIIGIADLRGDGRPDYAYHAHVLYGDSVTPARVPVTGGVVVIQGTGLTPQQTVAIGNTNASLLASNSGQLLVAAPAQSDGTQTVTVTDPVSGAFSIMSNVLTFGAAASDQLLLLSALNPSTPVGIPALNPISVRAVASDGVTPVNGATIGWSASNNAALSVCGGKSACSAVTDESGMSSTLATPAGAGPATVTATLAPGAYTPAQTVSAPISGSAPSAMNIGVANPFLWIAQGATVSVPITAFVVGNAGSEQGNVKVSFIITQGSASLSSSSATTNSAGDATVTLTLTNFSGNVQLAACVAQGNSPCQTVSVNSVAASMLNLQPFSGANQIITGTGFQPLTVRVTDSSTPPNPVLGASVLFQSTVMRPAGSDLIVTPGDSTGTQTGMPIILSTTQSTAQSGLGGLASFVPLLGPFTAPLEVEIQVAAGTGAELNSAWEGLAAIPEGEESIPGVSRR